MQRRRHWLVIAAAVLGCLGLAQPEGVCPSIAGDGGQVVRVGDWTLVPGVGLVACSDALALAVACDGGGDGLEVRLLLSSLAPGMNTVRITGAGGATRATARAASADGAIVLRGVDAEAVAALLATGEALRFAVASDGDGTPVLEGVFATSRFAEALPWLGCDDADACPVRSCGR